MSKVTEWFPGDVKPVRVGVYERQYKMYNNVGTAYWNWSGKQWDYGGAEHPQGVRVSVVPMPDYEQALPWRGLATRPSKRGKR